MFGMHASSEQVRQPLLNEGIIRWLNMAFFQPILFTRVGFFFKGENKQFYSSHG